MTPQLAEVLRTGDGPSRWLKHYSVGGNCPRSLERILALGQQRGFQVVLVAPPVTRSHRQAYTPQIEQAFQDYLAGVQRRYPCRFVDCRDWMEDSLFVDSHHHRMEGGLYFSRLLTYRVLVPLLAPLFLVASVYYGIKTWNGDDVRIPVVTSWLDERMPQGDTNAR